MKKIILSIGGMTCSACSNGLEKYLNKQEHIKSASVNLIMSSVSIEYDDKKISIQDIEKYIKEAGFTSLGKYKLNFEEKQNKKEQIKLLFISIFSLIVMYISMAHTLGFPIISLLDSSQNVECYAITLLILTTLVIVLSIDIVKNGIKNLIHQTPNMDTLISLGVLTSYIYSVFETTKIVSVLNNIADCNLYFESTAMVLLFVKIGKYIESSNKNKTKEAIQKLVTITPKDAFIIKDDDEKRVTIDEINIGDIVICKPGEKIAVDGEIIKGETHIDESFITGESFPAKKVVGMKVIAGSINCEGSIRYKAEKIGKESAVSKIVKMVVEATNTKAPIGRLADKISGIFVPIVIAISIITFIIWFLISKDFATSMNYFVSCLVIACPCSLGLATPLAMVVAMGNASSKGILIKSGDVLEKACQIKNIFIDKTGTLTYGKIQVSKIINYSNDDISSLLTDVASIEKKSEHPLAKAIVNYAKENGIITKKCDKFQTLVGNGVYAVIENNEYYIGNKQLAEENLADKQDANFTKNDELNLSSEGYSVVYVIKNGTLICLIGLKDIIREDSKIFISNLKDNGVEAIMLTGDNEVTANIIAKEIGINQVFANSTPKIKSEKILEYKENGIVAMCGDGINDSVSLANADIGIAVANGTDISIDSASVVLMNDNLFKIIDLIDISKKTIRIIKQNLFWAFLYNVLMIPVACGVFTKFGIKINPMFGSAMMMLSSMIVVLNSLRLANKKS